MARIWQICSQNRNWAKNRSEKLQGGVHHARSKGISAAFVNTWHFISALGGLLAESNLITDKHTPPTIQHTYSYGNTVPNANSHTG